MISYSFIQNLPYVISLDQVTQLFDHNLGNSFSKSIHMFVQYNFLLLPNKNASIDCMQ